MQEYNMERAINKYNAPLTYMVLYKLHAPVKNNVEIKVEHSVLVLIAQTNVYDKDICLMITLRT